ncbi:MAG: FHA domain-containing protein [Pseudomonadota bacterium]
MPPEYVKPCPQCGLRNPEHEDVCPQCGQFLGLVRPVVLEREVAAAPDNHPAPDAGPPGDDRSAAAGPGPAPGPAEPRLVLESLANGRTFQVLSGQTVGQAHPTSRAEVQMSGVPDLNYVSRHHCRFDFEEGGWSVTCLPAALNGLTLRGNQLAPGGRAPARDGDRLELANVPFIIRIYA